MKGGRPLEGLPSELISQRDRELEVELMIVLSYPKKENPYTNTNLTQRSSSLETKPKQGRTHVGIPVGLTCTESRETRDRKRLEGVGPHNGL